MGFESHPHDACVFIKKVGDSVVMLCCHVDDLLVAGRRDDVKEIFEELKRKVDATYKEVTGSTTYLGRRLEIKDDEVICYPPSSALGQNMAPRSGLRNAFHTWGAPRLQA